MVIKMVQEKNGVPILHCFASGFREGHNSLICLAFQKTKSWALGSKAESSATQCFMILVVFGTEIKRPAELPHNLIESLF